MCRLYLILLTTFVVALSAVGLHGCGADGSSRNFTVDHEANTFLMDGKPFRYVSGSFHYFRALPEVWQARLKTMRAAGLNAIDTYVEWSLHNPHDGVYNWQGIADVERFIQLAHNEGFYVILRPGPYICAERDNGGLPHWLFTKHPEIQLRTSDVNYHAEVRKWYGELMPRMQRFLYGNGGPIIMVQVENEYGDYHACDAAHLTWLRDETRKYVEDKALLFTTDIPNERIQCGKIEGVFATIDFGLERASQFQEAWQTLRTVQPTGPLVNSEFYSGWLNHWQESNQRRDGKLVADLLRKILESGANVNFYMFFGGTNFGFTAGANFYGDGYYVADLTSYDYDAVMTEAGGVTDKYHLVREVIADFLDIADYESCTACAAPIAIAYGSVPMVPIARLLSEVGRSSLAHGAPINATRPKTFEELDQYSGLVLYETDLPPLELDPTVLRVLDLHDRAYVFIDEQLVGTLSRKNLIYSLPLPKGWGSRLQLLVENQGRINFDVTNDTKGIFGDITVERFCGEQQVLTNWTSTAFPLEGAQMDAIVEQYRTQQLTALRADAGKVLTHGPVIYHGEFMVDKLGDSYLNTLGWGKGVAYVNGFNLGRYWPIAGPQLTLYVPKDVLKVGANTLVLLEYQRANLVAGEVQPLVQFDATPQLDGEGREIDDKIRCTNV